MALEFDEQLSRLQKPDRSEMTDEEYAIFDKNVETMMNNWGFINNLFKILPLNAKEYIGFLNFKASLFNDTCYLTDAQKEMIGVVVSAAAIGGVLYLLNEAWGYGTDQIPAAQATMMKMLVEGIMDANLPWALILIGVCIAIVVEILQVPVMPFAVGMYLPFSLSAGIMAGGAVRWIVERVKGSDEEKKERADRGVLFTSGLIAGEGIMGILLAVLAVAGVDGKIQLPFALPQIGSLIIFVVLLFGLFKLCMKKNK